MIMLGNEKALTGLLFVNDESFDKNAFENYEEKLLPVFDETRSWLNEYFDGKNPRFTPKIDVSFLTSFQKQVSDIMREIPYGETTTYGEIAKNVAKTRGIERMSAQAVGGAVGANPICIIIPCHRVLGANGFITGYSGGLENKRSLLKLENVPFKDSVRRR